MNNNAINNSIISIVCFGLLILTSESADAGMGYPTISDFGRLRLKTLSFFLVAFLLFSYLFHICWHQIRNAIPRLPKLSFRQSMGMMFLWGLVFIVVLIMISGARELMTPGAWKKNGFTYQLTEASRSEKGLSVVNSDLANEKINSLLKLKVELMQFAENNSGRFPSEEEYKSWTYDLKKIPNTLGATWVYVPESTIEDSKSLLFFHPFSENESLTICLFVDGSMQVLSKEEFNSIRASQNKEEVK